MTTQFEPGNRAAFARAVELLRENAKELLQCHTIGGNGDWSGEEEAKAAHDELNAVADKLNLYLGGQVSDVTAVALQPTPDAFELRQALQFYADGNHFIPVDPDAWDSVSGEPSNFLEDDGSTVMVEDGSVAKLALAGSAMGA